MTCSKGLIRPGFGASSKTLGGDGETQKMLEIVVHSVQHLPKMDTFGKCDPFVKVIYGSEPSVQTQVIKNVWEAFFEEKFGWDITDSEGKVITTPSTAPVHNHFVRFVLTTRRGTKICMMASNPANLQYTQIRQSGDRGTLCWI